MSVEVNGVHHGGVIPVNHVMTQKGGPRYLLKLLVLLAKELSVFSNQELVILLHSGNLLLPALELVTVALLNDVFVRMVLSV